MNPPAPFPELRAYFERNLNEYLDLLRQMVLINSFTANPAGVDALGRVRSGWVDDRQSPHARERRWQTRRS